MQWVEVFLWIERWPVWFISQKLGLSPSTGSESCHLEPPVSYQGEFLEGVVRFSSADEVGVPAGFLWASR